MTILLCATAQALLSHDTTSNITSIIEDQSPAYYGISWFANDDRVFLSHSGGVGNLNSVEAYFMSEVGYVAAIGHKASPQLLSNPHQILCIEPPYIIATNTGRNAIAVINCDDWSTRQLRFDDIQWDRFDLAGQGAHFNSVEFRDGRIFVLAHNFDAGAYEIEIEWPSLRTIGRRSLPGRQLHNLWHRDNDTHISCDSPNGGLLELNSGRSLWQHPDERRFYTRGLASNGRHIFVGATEIAERAERDARPSRIMVLDAETYKLEDTIELGSFADVTEIRLIDEVDLCHPNGLLQNAHLLPRKIATETPNAPRPKRVIAPTSAAEKTFDLITQRDMARDEAHEAVAQRNRLDHERNAMIIERDAALAERDEARVQQNRLTSELNARIAERDAAKSNGDEAVLQTTRLKDEVSARIAERDAAISNFDEALSQMTRLKDELTARIAERDAATAERDENYVQKRRVEIEQMASRLEQDAANSSRTTTQPHNASMPARSHRNWLKRLGDALGREKK